MTVALLHSNGQLRTERGGDTENGCKKKLLYSRRLLVMMMMNFGEIFLLGSIRSVKVFRALCILV